MRSCATALTSACRARSASSPGSERQQTHWPVLAVADLRDGQVLFVQDTRRTSDGAGFDIEPAWSADGMRIAYVNAPQMGGGTLHVLNAESGQPITITKRGKAKVQLVAWSAGTATSARGRTTSATASW